MDPLRRKTKDDGRGRGVTLPPPLGIGSPNIRRHTMGSPRPGGNSDLISTPKSREPEKKRANGGVKNRLRRRCAFMRPAFSCMLYPVKGVSKDVQDKFMDDWSHFGSLTGQKYFLAKMDAALTFPKARYAQCPGELVMTRYRLCWIPCHNETWATRGIGRFLSVPLGWIEKISVSNKAGKDPPKEQEGRSGSRVGPNGRTPATGLNPHETDSGSYPRSGGGALKYPYLLELKLKDMSKIVFGLTGQHTMSLVVQRVKAYTFPSTKESSFVYTYRSLKTMALPVMEGPDPSDPGGKTIGPPSADRKDVDGWINGWELYNPRVEYARMGIPNEDLQIEYRTNKDYEYSETYPRMFVLPTERHFQRKGLTTTRALAALRSFRSKARIPVCTWKHHAGTQTIWRCSQPRVGIMNNQCKADIELIKIIGEINSVQKHVDIFDARPKVNAYANKISKQGGWESTDVYRNASIFFMDIHNIHAVRDSYQKMCKAVYKPNFQQAVGASAWLRHIAAIMTATFKMVFHIDKLGRSILSHCSDGWDRTAQLVTLTQLCIDPYYRTVRGFIVLIEKDWLSFGHKFQQRCGHFSDKDGDDQRSPIFIQWLDCVHQLMVQFPRHFQFNLKFLVTLLHHVYSCRFGTFLYNQERERVGARLRQNTHSLWTYMLQSPAAVRGEFLNPYYDPSGLGVVPALMGLSQFANPVPAPESGPSDDSSQQSSEKSASGDQVLKSLDTSKLFLPPGVSHNTHSQWPGLSGHLHRYCKYLQPCQVGGLTWATGGRHRWWNPGTHLGCRKPGFALPAPQHVHRQLCPFAGRRGKINKSDATKDKKGHNGELGKDWGYVWPKPSGKFAYNKTDATKAGGSGGSNGTGGSSNTPSNSNKNASGTQEGAPTIPSGLPKAGTEWLPLWAKNQFHELVCKKGSEGEKTSNNSTGGENKVESSPQTPNTPHSKPEDVKSLRNAPPPTANPPIPDGVTRLHIPSTPAHISLKHGLLPDEFSQFAHNQGAVLYPSSQPHVLRVWREFFCRRVTYEEFSTVGKGRFPPFGAATGCYAPHGQQTLPMATYLLQENERLAAELEEKWRMMRVIHMRMQQTKKENRRLKSLLSQSQSQSQTESEPAGSDKPVSSTQNDGTDGDVNRGSDEASRYDDVKQRGARDDGCTAPQTLRKTPKKSTKSQQKKKKKKKKNRKAHQATDGDGAPVGEEKSSGGVDGESGGVVAVGEGGGSVDSGRVGGSGQDGVQGLSGPDSQVETQDPSSEQTANQTQTQDNDSGDGEATSEPLTSQDEPSASASASASVTATSTGSSGTDDAQTSTATPPQPSEETSQSDATATPETKPDVEGNEREGQDSNPQPQQQDDFSDDSIIDLSDGIEDGDTASSNDDTVVQSSESNEVDDIAQAYSVGE